MKSGFLGKLIARLDKLDPKSLESHFLRLAQERGLMEAIFQAIRDGIIVLEGDGRISYFNRAAEDLLGLEPDAMSVGTPIGRYLREIDWDRILSLDAGEWSKLISQQIEITYPKRRLLSFYVVPLATGDSVEKGVLIMLRDVTREADQEQSMVESERLNAVNLLAAGVAHEIGNPLNALSIHLQLINREITHLDTEDRETIGELLAVAKNEVSRLDAILNQFLRAVRPARPKLALVQIEDALTETMALLKEEIGNRGIHVEIDREGGVPKVSVDAQQMKQAFFNVIKNALEAMQDGGFLTIRLSSSDRFVGISFTDTGTGIAREEFGKIFEPYHTTKPRGSGLGLMVVQRIVQDHGGTIEVHSEQDVGTTVTILLPRARRRLRLLKSRTPGAEVQS